MIVQNDMLKCNCFGLTMIGQVMRSALSTFANVLLKTWQWKPVENARIDETDLVLSLFLSNF